MTISLQLNRDLMAWLQRRSQQLGVAPETLLADNLKRERFADEFRALSQTMTAEARAQGLSDETLTELLDGETYD